MLCLPTSWRVSLQPLHPHLLSCTAQATPLLPIRPIFAFRSHGNVPGNVTHCPPSRYQHNSIAFGGYPILL